MNRLDTIATRHKSSRLRDALFALCVATAGIVSLTAVGTAAHAAQVSQR